MPHPSINGLVGLIVIEAPTSAPVADRPNPDETLAQLFDWLSGGDGPDAGRSRDFVARLPAADRFEQGSQPARVAADFRELDAQLQGATAHLRHVLAAAAVSP